MVLYDGDYFTLEQLEDDTFRIKSKSCEIPLLEGKRLGWPQTVTGLILKVCHNAIAKNDSNAFKSLGHLLVSEIETNK